jgi:hypothetical protein
VWCVDLVLDATRHGVTLKFLTIVDKGSHYCIDIVVGRPADKQTNPSLAPIKPLAAAANRFRAANKIILYWPKYKDLWYL